MISALGSSVVPCCNTLCGANDSVSAETGCAPAVLDVGGEATCFLAVVWLLLEDPVVSEVSPFV